MIARHVIDFLLICGLAVFTVNRFAPDVINGDVILYSVMSLQNVTLFFWEQNRLINFGPAVTALIRDPAWNVLANFVFPPLAFFWLLRLWSGQVLRLGGRVKDGFGVHALFMLQACVWLVVLKDHAIYEVVIWHVEYPLSLLLLALAWIACLAWRAARSLRYICVTALLVLATGVNFSIVLPALAVMVARVVFRRRVDFDGLLFSALAVFIFAGWWLVARMFPGPGPTTYSGFSFETLREGLPIVLDGLARSLDSDALVGVLLVLALCLTLSRFAGTPMRRGSGEGPLSVAVVAIGFALGWIGLFSGNAWVAINGHHMRYFIVALFGLSIPLAIAIASVSLPWRWVRCAVVAVAGLSVATVLYRPPVPLSEYEFARQTSPFVDVADGAVYGGDFNYAWSAVMNAMLRGDEAYGIASRANGNGAELRAYAEGVLDEEGVLPVVCIRMNRAACIADATRYIGALRERESEFIDGEPAGSRLLLERGLPSAMAGLDGQRIDGWAFEGAELVSQPGQVGRRSERGVRANGKAGFLFYGPHRSLKAGSYQLRVNGEIAAAEGAWLDVVARGGTVVYAKQPLQDGSGVVAERTVVIRRDEADIEVRVHVGKQSRLSIRSYELTRIGDR